MGTNFVWLTLCIVEGNSWQFGSQNAVDFAAHCYG